MTQQLPDKPAGFVNLTMGQPQPHQHHQHLHLMTLRESTCLSSLSSSRTPVKGDCWWLDMARGSKLYETRAVHCQASRGDGMDPQYNWLSTIQAPPPPPFLFLSLLLSTSVYYGFQVNSTPPPAFIFCHFIP